MNESSVDQRAEYLVGLEGALDNPEPMTRARAAWILGELQDPEAVPSLIASLPTHADDPEYLAAVAEALGKIGDRAAVPTLINLSAASFLKVRLVSVEALSQWTEREDVREALRQAFADSNAIVRRAALRIVRSQ